MARVELRSGLALGALAAAVVATSPLPALALSQSQGVAPPPSVSSEALGGGSAKSALPVSPAVSEAAVDSAVDSIINAIKARLLSVMLH